LSLRSIDRDKEEVQDSNVPGRSAACNGGERHKLTTPQSCLVEERVDGNTAFRCLRPEFLDQVVPTWENLRGIDAAVSDYIRDVVAEAPGAYL
jgi:hypothetical protein